MSVPDLSIPVVADALAAFGGEATSRSAEINFDVPLPGSYSWQRIVPLELDADVFLDGASKAGVSMLDQEIVQGEQGRLTGIDASRLAAFYRRTLPATARPSLRHVAQVGGDVAPLLTRAAQTQALEADGLDLLSRRAVVAEPDDVMIERQRIDSYIDRLAAMSSEAPATQRAATTMITLPMSGIGNSIHPVLVDPVARPTPTIALVEVWELRSFLGDYGLGRTLQTFSLLPGERTTITVETWRNEAATREDATSIFDSSDTAAQTRFTDSLSNQSGTASQDQGGWAASISTSVSAGANLFGIVSGSASLSAGFAANHQEASQQFSNSASESASEHASQVNNSRRQSVESTSSTTSAQGTATTTVREISNTNLRRVLNFVFRELDQEFETYVVLRDIKVAFYNGNPGSAEIVPLAGLGSLLRQYVDPSQAETVARAVLSLSAQRFDANADLVTTMEVGTNPNGIQYDWQPVELNADGSLQFRGDVLSSDVRWRFPQGSLSKDDENGHTVKGVIMNRSTIVLRTDNLVVEGLLGQADTLDPYAAALQALDLQDRNVQTEVRQTTARHDNDALDLVAAQPAPDRIDAWQKLFPEDPEIQVVPAAAVTIPAANSNDGSLSS
ncbi:hypothetical protein SAMN05660350_04549 [Geodermatophilus obscurus]|uniref:Uncharacterized protein n=1 Tax=Geodermatophilus obscurus TaxID=1861 RepID=A0A1M7V012_9ACTN|nr:hypothetical protein [Geodermatophilus obscurus]SHN88516.1 hypothetical protein SAMN05660350_04549 [Geodermatophilus obscurus]